MTSGSKGFHVVTPLAATVSFEDIGRFSQTLAVMLAQAHAEQLTVEFLKKERKGRVFIDWMRNHFGSDGGLALLAAAAARCSHRHADLLERAVQNRTRRL